jgi:hypothetical protein
VWIGVIEKRWGQGWQKEGVDRNNRRETGVGVAEGRYG